MKELTLTVPWGEYVRLKEKVDLIKMYDYFIHIFCVMEHTYLPDAQRALLSYYAAAGGITSEVEKQYANDFNRTKQAVSNLKYDLTKRGFLTKKEDSNAHELPGFLKQKRSNVTIIIELDARERVVQEGGE